MNILSPEAIAAKYKVSQEQIDAATRILNAVTGEIWYQINATTIEDTEEKLFEVHAKGKGTTCTCALEQPCWHRRAAAAAQFEFRQQENVAYRKEAAEAAARKAAEEQARRDLPLNGNQDFSLLAQGTPRPAQRKRTAPAVARGVDFRIQRIGATWMNEQAHGWMTGNELPAEWTAICADSTVIKAIASPPFAQE